MNLVPILAWALLPLLLSVGVSADQPARGSAGAFGFRATVEGEQFEARFGDFEVVPRLDAARRPTGFSVEIAMAAIDSGNADRDAEMQLAEWFDTAAHPVASFHAQEVGIRQQGGYVASGELRIKGVRRSVSVPFSWQAGSRHLRLSGEVPLDRRWFGVGPGDDSSVAARVTVFFDLTWGADEN